MQLTNEYRALQKLGRKLCFQQGVVDISMTKRILYKSADDATHEQAADMMMPATDISISRVVDAWHDLKVGYLRFCRGWASFWSPLQIVSNYSKLIQSHRLLQTPANSCKVAQSLAKPKRGCRIKTLGA